MVIILNFGSQFAHLIARRIRALGVHAELVPYNLHAREIAALKPAAIVFSGGPFSVYAKNAPLPNANILNLNVPILGICYGQQIIAHLLGGKVRSGETKEFGREALYTNKNTLFSGWKSSEDVWFSHGDEVVKVPKGFIGIAKTHNCKFAAIMHNKLPIYGVQFHPEVVHTAKGDLLINNFLFRIAKASTTWKPKELIKEIVREISDTVENGAAIIGISGGVDSLVAGVLAKEALGKRLYPIFVDTGLLRLDEVASVRSMLRNMGFPHLITANAKKDFFEALKGVLDPEEKRRRIGHTFIRVFEREVKKLKKNRRITHFIQGTIYPDRIESAGTGNNTTEKIKSHHNLALPERLGFAVLEPLRNLYKDEVRLVGKKIGIPDYLLERQPFPGPGLAVRIMGEVTPERVQLLQRADAIVQHELEKTGKKDIWQAFAALITNRAVGVMGDARVYGYLIAIRAVSSVDGMTADWVRLPEHTLQRISQRITREVPGVTRVLYDVTEKPPATIEYE